MTLRDNVLFSKPFNKECYNRVIDACALRPDLDILPAGDKTEIGERVLYHIFVLFHYPHRQGCSQEFAIGGGQAGGSGR